MYRGGTAILGISAYTPPQKEACLFPSELNSY